MIKRINYKIKLEQRYEQLSQYCSKKFIKLEDDLKTELESLKVELVKTMMQVEKLVYPNPSCQEFEKTVHQKFEVPI